MNKETVRQDTQLATQESKRELKNRQKKDRRGTGKNPRSLVRQWSIHRQRELGTAEGQATFRQISRSPKTGREIGTQVGREYTGSSTKGLGLTEQKKVGTRLARQHKGFQNARQNSKSTNRLGSKTANIQL